jgi:hypothetical protein
VTNVWQAREVGELRKRGRLVKIRRWRKRARRRKNAKPPFFEGAHPSLSRGRYATEGHIIELGEWIFSKEMENRILTLYPAGRPVQVRITDLRKKLKKLGEKYIEKNPLLWKDARASVEEYGLLAPLHDILLEGSKTHARYQQTGWLHSNTTCVLLLALGLALLPWGIASCFNNFALAPTIIFEEFWWAAGLGFLVQRLSRSDSDLNETFLSWLVLMQSLESSTTS